MTTRKDLTVGEVTKDDLKRWYLRIEKQKWKERYSEFKNRIELLKLKMNNNATEKICSTD